MSFAEQFSALADIPYPVCAMQYCSRKSSRLINSATEPRMQAHTVLDVLRLAFAGDPIMLAT